MNFTNKQEMRHKLSGEKGSSVRQSVGSQDRKTQVKILFFCCFILKRCSYEALNPHTYNQYSNTDVLSICFFINICSYHSFSFCFNVSSKHCVLYRNSEFSFLKNCQDGLRFNGQHMSARSAAPAIQLFRTAGVFLIQDTD